MLLENKNKSKNLYHLLIAFLVVCLKTASSATNESINELSAYNFEELQKLPEVNGSIFYYFGFGSNMLTKRIHIQNPTAKKIGAAKLEVSVKHNFFQIIF